MLVVNNKNKLNRVEDIGKIIIALKAYWTANKELELKDVIEAVKAEFNIKDINEVSDELIEKFLINNIESEG